MFRILYEEDTCFGDITSELIIPEDMEAVGRIVCKEQCIVAGASYISRELSALGIATKVLVKDGTEARAGTVVMELSGLARDILKVERTVLNILGRMSGIATLTRELVERVSKINSNVCIAATRKTLWGYLDKLAVKIGGGDTHRWNLGDMVMIKDNHIALVGLENAINKAKKVSFSKKIEVEVESEEDALKAAELGVDIILLDNMSSEEVCELAEKLRNYPVKIEVSGGITPENVEEYARCNVDIISLGYLTHSASSINFSLELSKK